MGNQPLEGCLFRTWVCVLSIFGTSGWLSKASFVGFPLDRYGCPLFLRLPFRWFERNTTRNKGANLGDLKQGKPICLGWLSLGFGPMAPASSFFWGKDRIPLGERKPKVVTRRSREWQRGKGTQPPMLGSGWPGAPILKDDKNKNINEVLKMLRTSFFKSGVAPFSWHPGHSSGRHFLG